MVRNLPTLLLAALLAGCGTATELAWDVHEPEALGALIVENLYGLRYQEGGEARAEGPHVTGSAVQISAIHPNPNQVVEGWSISSDASAIARVQTTTADRGGLYAEVELGEVGSATLTVRDDGGNTVDTLLITVDVPVAASLQPYVDLRSGFGPPVGEDGTLRVVEDASTSVVLTWRNEAEAPMTGTGVLSVDLPAEAVGKITVETALPYAIANVEGFVIEGAEPTTTPLALDAYAGASKVATWMVEVLPESALDAVDLAIDLESGDASDGSGRRRIGYLRPDVFSLERRVLGLEARWFEDGAELGSAPFAELLEADELHTIMVCVPDTEVCDEIVEFGQLGRLGDGPLEAAGGCGCSQSGGAGWGGVLAMGALALARRRRGGAVR